VMIDAASLRSLEIERTMRSGDTEGSLLSVMQRCRTPMGKRLLRHWLCFPLRDISAISARQSTVATLLHDTNLFAELAEHIAMVQDVARIVGRVAMQRANPRDLVALGCSAAKISAITESIAGTPALADHHQRLSALRDTIAPLAKEISERCVETPPHHLREG